MTKFVCDGCVYHYDHDDNVEGLVNFERVVVTDFEGNYIGEIEWDHNIECASAILENGESNSINYFEVSNMAHEDVARLVIAIQIA